MYGIPGEEQVSSPYKCLYKPVRFCVNVYYGCRSVYFGTNIIIKFWIKYNFFHIKYKF